MACVSSGRAYSGKSSEGASRQRSRAEVDRNQGWQCRETCEMNGRLLFLLGLVVGSVGGLSVALFLLRSEHPAPPEQPPLSEPPAVTSVEENELETEPLSLVVEETESPVVVGSPGNGTIELRVGQGHVFGTAEALDVFDPEDVDIICLDIRSGAALRAPHGVMEAEYPLHISGEIPTLEVGFEELADAPMALPGRHVWVRSASQSASSGIALVRSTLGTSFKLRLSELSGALDVRERSVRLRYVEVEALRGGGVIPMPEAVLATPTTEKVLERAKEIVERAGDLPGNHRSMLSENYVTLDMQTLEDGLELDVERSIAFDAPLSGAVHLKRGGALFAPYGVSRDGAIEYGGYTGVIVDGDMAGRIVADSYGYVYISGDLTGEILCESYSTVVVEGDVTGIVHMGSYVSLFLGGSFRGGTLPQMNGSCWSTIYIDGYTSRSELETLVGDDQVTVHLHRSDLVPGSHKDVGKWREVVVGDEVWSQMATR